jgi:tetratricopeptide (TPR) repeat protein
MILIFPNMKTLNKLKTILYFNILVLSIITVFGILINTNKLFSQENVIISLLNKAENSDLSLIKINALNLLALEYLKNDPDKAYNYGKIAYKYSKHLDNNFSKASSLINIAFIFIYSKNDYDRALSCFRKAFIISQNLDSITDSKIITAKIFDGFGLINFRTEDNEKSIKCYRQALEFYIQMDDYQNISNCYHYLGLIYEKIGDHKEATLNYQKEIETYNRIAKGNYKNDQKSEGSEPDC